jgi:hypothetical protein
MAYIAELTRQLILTNGIILMSTDYTYCSVKLQARLPYFEMRLLALPRLPVCLSVCPHRTTRSQKDGFSFDLPHFFLEIVAINFKYHQNLTIIMGIHADQCELKTIPLRVLL